MLVLGLDPGKAGGVAARNHEGLITAHKFPVTERDLADLVQELAQLDEGGQVHAFIEKVHSTPQMGVKSAFTFGQGFGGIRMCLVCHQIPFEEVRPQVWQKALGCLSRGDKNVTKAKAQQLFPTHKVTHAIADAMLIAEWGWRHLNR